jgi:hypothetical protein
VLAGRLPTATDLVQLRLLPSEPELVEPVIRLSQLPAGGAVACREEPAIKGPGYRQDSPATVTDERSVDDLFTCSCQAHSPAIVVDNATSGKTGLPIMLQVCLRLPPHLPPIQSFDKHESDSMSKCSEGLSHSPAVVVDNSNSLHLVLLCCVQGQCSDHRQKPPENAKTILHLCAVLRLPGSVTHRPQSWTAATPIS